MFTAGSQTLAHHISITNGGAGFTDEESVQFHDINGNPLTSPAPSRPANVSNDSSADFDRGQHRGRRIRIGGLADPARMRITHLFYAHYVFASITAHLLAMYPPFLAVLLAKGAQPGLIIFAFACFANLSAGLTNYGTTPAPMFYAQEYVGLERWWRVGLIVSVVNLLIWGTVGFE